MILLLLEIGNVTKAGQEMILRDAIKDWFYVLVIVTYKSFYSIYSFHKFAPLYQPLSILPLG
jgi:hypothetical protein